MLRTNLFCSYRFVRFVSTPEVLERVYYLESEILQIEKGIAIQSNNDTGLSSVSKIVKHLMMQSQSLEFNFGCPFLSTGRRSSSKTCRAH